MIKIEKYHSLLLFIIMLVFYSCEDAQKDRPTSKLEGKWLLQKAYRNEMPTESLRNLYYQFSAEQVRTNLTGQEELAHYSYENNKITVEDGPLPISYNAIFINDSTIELKTSIQNHSFRLLLLKKDTLLLNGI